MAGRPACGGEVRDGVQQYRGSSSLPRLRGEGGRPKAGRVGAVRESASSHRPHPGLRFALADPPHKGGGIRRAASSARLDRPNGRKRKNGAVFVGKSERSSIPETVVMESKSRG